VRLLLRDCHAIILEANHDEVLLRTSGYPASVQQRIAGSGGHLSNTAALDLLTEVLHHELELVVLAHLSARCNTADCARDAVEPGLRREGFTGRLVVAPQAVADEPLELEGRRPTADC
jgi:phosphoribosyl 1,2-cyclic phosphodiesterase